MVGELSEKMVVRVRQGERERRAEVTLSDKVRTLLQEFEQEAKGRTVRFIFRGKELKLDDTFQSAQMKNNDTCHLTLGRDVKKASPIRSDCQSEENDLGAYDMFLIALMTLCVMFWLLLLSLPELSSQSTSVLMAMITFVSSLTCFARASACSNITSPT